MPIATTSKNGLMAADTYKASIKHLTLIGSKLVKVYTKSGTFWNRKSCFVFVVDENKCSLYCCSCIDIKNENTKFKVYNLYGNDSRINFYKKEDCLYIYYNSQSSNNISIIGASCENIEYVSQSLDDSFTLIDIE